MVIKLTPLKILLAIIIVILFFLLIFIAPTEKFGKIYEKDEFKLPIIMYHRISTDKNRLNENVITPEQFQCDLKYIKDKGYTTITMTQLINHKLKNSPLPSKPIIICFDDGFDSIYVYAYPLLKKYNMCAIISVVGMYADKCSQQELHNIGYSNLCWSEISELSKTRYFEIQNHSYNMHEQYKDRIGAKRKPTENEEEYVKTLSDDIKKMQNLVYKNTGFMPNTFVYPLGFNSELFKNVLTEMGFTAALTFEPRVNVIGESTDLMGLGRINRPYGQSSETFFKGILE